MTDEVRYQRVGAAAVLTIDRPHRRNAVDGPMADELAAAFDAAGRPYSRVGTVANAVAAAAREAAPGEVVLLSPACASYDQYRNFEERGEDFRRLVANLP